MESYKLANDQEGYSLAFEQYRHSLFRKYFGWIVLSIAIIITAFLKMLVNLKRMLKKVLRKHMEW